jgi:cytochrome P450
MIIVAQGPRGCVGIKFATQEFMLAFIHLHQRFSFRAVGQGELVMKAGLTLAPAQPVLVTVTNRK